MASWAEKQSLIIHGLQSRESPWRQRFRDQFAGQQVLVTGAAGFIGSNLTRKLLDAGCIVTALVRPGTNSWRLRDLRGKIDIVEFDLRRTSLPKIPECTLTYHLASAGVNPSLQGDESLIQTNVLGAINALKIAKQSKSSRFVFAGSCFEYGVGEYIPEDVLPAPKSVYGATKLAAWTLVQTLARAINIEIVSLRLFNAFGPFEDSYRLIPTVIIKAIRGESIPLTSGTQRRDFIFVEDVVDAFLACGLAKDVTGNVFNVSTGVATPVKQIVLQIVGLLDSDVSLLFGALPYPNTEAFVLSGNPEKANLKLGWSAQTSLSDGIALTVAWFQQNLKELFI